MGEPRGDLGHSGANPSSCARISGDAQRRNQRDPSGLTATDVCVRAVSPGAPARTAVQSRHPQFHCGNPPPAAAPNTLILMTLIL